MEISYDIAFVLGVFAAGFLSFFSPCIFPLLPVYSGILIDDVGEKFIKIGKLKIYTRPIVKTLAFIAGISFIFVILGFGAGVLGNIIYSRYTVIAMGIIVVILGIHQAEFFTINTFNKQKKVNFNKNKRKGILGSFLLGLGFSFGWSPCIGPVLGAILAVSASGSNQAIFGAVLMVVYTLGLAIPFLVISFTSTLVAKYSHKIKKNMLTIKRVGGIIIIIMGLLLIFGQFNLLATLFN